MSAYPSRDRQRAAAAPVRLALLFLFCAFAAHAQFDLVLADGAPVPPVYNLGQVYAGESAVVHFRLRNLSSSRATVTSLSVDGVGFTLAAPAVPVGIAAQGEIAFTVTFRAGEMGGYSAALHSVGISILLTATVLPSFTYRIDNGGGFVPLTAIDFGAVVRGSIAQRRITLRNETSEPLIVPPISLQGDAFSLGGLLPSGQTLQPQQGGEFTVIFKPLTAGTRQGTLAIGDRSYPLLGVGAEPPLPKPSVTIDLPLAAGAQQGTLLIRFDAPAETVGTGLATLDFSGPADPTIVFATGGRTTNFSVAPGDTQVALPFQTGTTAGTLTFKVQLGQETRQQSVAIGAAQVAITAAQGVRSSGSLEFNLTGFDNTRTLAALAFKFYDGAGKTIAAIRSDATGDFAKFFTNSDRGGVFLLRAVFPVSGDASQVAGCEVGLTNAVGTAVQRVQLPVV